MVVPPDSIQSLDLAVRPLLLAARNTYHGRLEAATFLVGLGVLLEAFEIFHDVRDDFSEYRAHNGLFAAPALRRVRFPWIVSVSLIGWLMVAAGVVGEYWYDGAINDFDATIQRIDNESLIQAGVGAANANREAASANQRAAGLEVEAAQLRKDAANEQLEVAKLRAPRQFTDKQFAALREKLKAFAGTRYEFWVYGDDESVQFMRQLDNLLFSAGWIRKIPQDIPPNIFVRLTVGSRSTLGGPLVDDVMPLAFNADVRIDTGSDVYADASHRDWSERYKAYLALVRGLVADGFPLSSQGQAFLPANSPVRIAVGERRTYEYPVPKQIPAPPKK